MNRKKEAYVCKKCGYILPKREAVVSGWDAEGSLRHIHCPRCRKDNHSYTLATCMTARDRRIEETTIRRALKQY